MTERADATNLLKEKNLFARPRLEIIHFNDVYNIEEKALSKTQGEE